MSLRLLGLGKSHVEYSVPEFRGDSFLLDITRKVDDPEEASAIPLGLSPGCETLVIRMLLENG